MDDTCSNDKKPFRGPNFKVTEDIQICYAWIAASEGVTCSTNMRSNNFKEKLHKKYVQLIQKYNTDMCTDFGPRNSTGCWKRFKKISQGLSKYLGIEESVGAPLSGDTNKEKWNQKVSDLFLKRYPEFVKLIQTIKASEDVIGDNPKWRAFKDEEETDEAPSNKRRKKSDTECLDFYKDYVTAKEKRKQDHRQKTERFMEEVSSALKELVNLLNNNMKQQEIKLIGMLSPNSKKQMAKKLLEQQFIPTEIHVVNGGSISVTENDGVSFRDSNRD